MSKHNNVLTGLPKETVIVSTDNGNSGFIKLGQTLIKQGSISGIQIPGLKKWMGIYRLDTYWAGPSFGTDICKVQPQTQFLLWQGAKASYGVFLPLISGDLHATLSGTPQGLSMVYSGGLKGTEPDEAVLGYFATGHNPFQVIKTAMLTVSRFLGTFRVRDEKRTPLFADLLGWCTWDAFGREVDAKKVIGGLETFKKGGVQPSFVIMDDGWLDATDELLNDIPCDKKKFPQGLGKLIKKAKEQYNVKSFGIWNCFEGYWFGINPDGPLSKRFRLVANKAHNTPWNKENPLNDLSLIHPDQINQFYNELYLYLYKEGVDMVKVDCQSALDFFTHDKLGKISTMTTYQQALQGAAHNFFNGEVIHCGSHGADAVYNMINTNVVRNSYDYQPHRDDSAQAFHIFMNVYNAVWLSGIAITDWDMFQTYSPSAKVHAAFRAISGGPVYVSDHPGKQDFSVLKKMCISNGKILRCGRPALPAADVLFVDCSLDKRLLKVTNINGNLGVIGLINCNREKQPVTDSFKAGDVHDLKGDFFAAYFQTTGDVKVLSLKQKESITLSFAECEIVTLSPINDGAAPLGLLDKYNCGGAVKNWSKIEQGFACDLLDGGEIGFYCESKPKKIRVNGKIATGRYNKKTGLLVLSQKAGRPVTVDLIMR